MDRHSVRIPLNTPIDVLTNDGREITGRVAWDEKDSLGVAVFVGGFRHQEYFKLPWDAIAEVRHGS